MAPALHNGYALYLYTPSIVAAVIFVVVFFIATTAHVWRMFKARTFFCIPFVIGGIFEIIGYAGRCASHFNPPALDPYIIQSLLLLIAPALFAASIYMVLGRLIRSVKAEDLSLIPTKWLTKIFVLGDILSFFVQAGGAGIMVKGGNTLTTGKAIILAGLIIQIVLFGFFVFIMCFFVGRMDRRERSGNDNTVVPWRSVTRMLFGVSALILFRNVMRVVEYAMGQNGYPMAHEWWLYAFDSVPMLAVMVFFFAWYPDKIYHAGASGHIVMDGGEEGNEVVQRRVEK